MSGSRKKILWADDEIEFLRSHIMFLETRGYSVVPVFSGDDAIHLIRENPKEFDLVLLDEQMPGKTGLATLDEIKSMLPDLPVVMVTKSEEERVMEDAMGRKIDGYLTKPVNPSQILSVCKKVLDSEKYISSQISQRFVRSYSEIRQALTHPLGAAEWIRVFNELTYWDIELDKVKDEGLRQNHAGQKSDCSAAFCAYVQEHYGTWMKGEKKTPTLSTDVVKKYIVPRLKDGKRVYLIIMDCMRLDQYVSIESLLKTHFEIDRHCYYSVLPTAGAFCRNSLLDGRFPADVATAYPGIMDAWNNDDSSTHGQEKEMLLHNLKGAGLSPSDVRFDAITDAASAQAYIGSLHRGKPARLSAVVVNSVSMLTQGRSTSAILQEIAPDETAFRALTLSWFQHSPVYQLFRELAQEDATIILTTDHGSVLCGRGTEIYGTNEGSQNLRYKFGNDITCDDRHAFFLPSPAQFRIPSFTPEGVCIMAQENYFFVYPDKFKNLQNQYQNSFHYGGVSMEEMIVPLAVMNPKT